MLFKMTKVKLGLPPKKLLSYVVERCCSLLFMHRRYKSSQGNPPLITYGGALDIFLVDQNPNLIFYLIA